jgi:hypothetical protein
VFLLKQKICKILELVTQVERIAVRLAVMAIVTFFVSSCSFVDNFAPRIYQANENLQQSTNQEVLANIIRASMYQSLAWSPPNQFIGMQVETLNTGLPTITFGPNQPAANHLYQISNSLSSSTTGSYQSTPIVTTPFQTGMLSPVDLKTFGMLMTYYPREAVLFALIDAIDIQEVSSSNVLGKVSRLVNDPTQDFLRGNDDDHDGCKKRLKKAVRENDAKTIMLDDGVCPYSRFVFVLQGYLIAYGLTVELIASESKSNNSQANQSGGSSGGATQSSNSSSNQPTSIGQFCFSPSLAGTDEQTYVARTFGRNLCDQAPNKSKPSVSKTVVDKVQTGPNETTTTTTTTTGGSNNATGGSKNASNCPDGRLKVTIEGDGAYCVSMDVRSPEGFIKYLGLWLGNSDLLPSFSYRGITANQVLDIDHRYLNIVTDRGSGQCYTRVAYQSVNYCVPYDAKHTSMLMDMATSLRNLNITPADLNAPLNVRLSQ